jgi:hypothetical protein
MKSLKLDKCILFLGASLGVSLVFQFALAPVAQAKAANRCELIISEVAEPAPSVAPSGMLTQSQRESFIARAKMGGVDPQLGKSALVAAEKVSRVIGASVVGPGLNTCYSRFGAVAVSSVNRLLISASSAVTAKDFKDQLVGSYAKIFKVSVPVARERICVLAGHGPNGTPSCSIFGAPVADSCG